MLENREHGRVVAVHEVVAVVDAVVHSGTPHLLARSLCDRSPCPVSGTIDEGCHRVDSRAQIHESLDERQTVAVGPPDAGLVGESSFDPVFGGVTAGGYP